jgi:hypothetical protein
MLTVPPALSLVGRKGFRPQAIEPERLLGFDSTGIAHPATQLTVFEKDSNTIGQCSFIPSGYYESRLTIVDQVGNITSICSNNGTTTCHCFQYDVWTPFILGGMHKEGRIGK